MLFLQEPCAVCHAFTIRRGGFADARVCCYSCDSFLRTGFTNANHRLMGGTALSAVSNTKLVVGIDALLERGVFLNIFEYLGPLLGSATCHVASRRLCEYRHKRHNGYIVHVYRSRNIPVWLIHQVICVGPTAQQKLIRSVLLDVTCLWWKELWFRPIDGAILYKNGNYDVNPFPAHCMFGRLVRAEDPLLVRDCAIEAFDIVESVRLGGALHSGLWSVRSRWDAERQGGEIVLERADKRIVVLYSDWF